MDGAGASRGPLEGIRIADFTWAWAGPHGTLLLAMLGAEVIKIESRVRLDHARVISLMIGDVRGGIDESPFFNDLNLNKRSLTLNLKTEEARDIARRIAAVSDVVTANMRPGVLDRMGLSYEDLREVKPDIIMLSSSAVGGTGPERFNTGYAPTFAAMSGVVDYTGYPDEAPTLLSGSVDLRVGAMAAFAVLAALHHKQRTGEGQYIDLSSTEVMSAMMGEAFLEYSMNGRVPERTGNRDNAMAPHGCYRCQGEPPWISIAVGDEAEWAALRSVLEDPELGDDAFEGPLERWKNQDRLDEIVGRWTRERTADEAVTRLQRAGVPAMPVHTGTTLAADPHVRERGILQKVDHPKLGERLVVGPPWKLEGAGIRRASPLLGESNQYVLGEILGLSQDEIEKLERADALK
jgi:crotonobetainyl-CoA:carnitine CoA-transferase CaiB-like acyl-CoA transferase